MDVALSRFETGDVQTTPDGLVGYDVTEVRPIYEYHRDQLVSLGHLFHARYEFDQIPNVKDVHSAIWGRILQAFPNNPHTTLSYPDNELDVWDRPDRRAQWDSFFAETNSPDLAVQAKR